MLNKERKVTVELVNQSNTDKTTMDTKMSSPINSNYTNSDKISIMVAKILHEEFPMLENNSLLHDLVLYTLLEKVKTVQTVENVLSYIKENNVKKVDDVSFKNGEIHIKCST